MKNSETYLVTGGAGFIGSHIVEALARRGQDVRVLDNLSSGKRQNLAGVEGKFEWVEGDIRDLDTLRRAMKGCRYVLHQAAIRSVPRSVDDPVETHEVNVGGTLNVLLAASEAKVERVVYASSSSVYGDTDRLPSREDQMPGPVSPYAASKLAGELYARVFYELHGVKSVCLRYFNVFGPRQDPASKYAQVVPAFITWMMAGRSPQVHGDGTQTRDFVYVDNVVEANLRACESKEAPGEVFNVALGKAYSVLDIVNLINRSLGTKIAPTFLPHRKGDVPHTLADVTKVRLLFDGFKGIGFEEGMERTVRWFQQRECHSEPRSGEESDVRSFGGLRPPQDDKDLPRNDRG